MEDAGGQVELVEGKGIIALMAISIDEFAYPVR